MPVKTLKHWQLILTVCTYIRLDARMHTCTYSVLHNPPSLTGLYRNVCTTCIIIHLLYAQLYTVTMHNMKCTIITSVSLQTPHTHVRTYIHTCLQYTLLLSLQFYFCAYFHVANLIHGHQCTLTPASHACGGAVAVVHWDVCSVTSSFQLWSQILTACTMYSTQCTYIVNIHSEHT